MIRKQGFWVLNWEGQSPRVGHEHGAGVVQVLVTGKATDDNGNYHDSKHSFDDGFVPPPGSVRDQQGNITILVSNDGQRYTVTSAAGFSATYSAVDPPAEQ